MTPSERTIESYVTATATGFVWSRRGEIVAVDAYGRNGVRVQATRNAALRELPHALLEPAATQHTIAFDAPTDSVTLTNGAIAVTLRGTLGRLAFARSSDGAVVLREPEKTTAEHLARTYTPRPSSWRIEQRFLADHGEKIYGLGQRQHGFLNQKGCVLDLMHRNTEVSIPFMISNKGYGFLWNAPGIGRVELGRNDTRWVVDTAHQLDYYVVVDESPSAILERYAEATGFPTAFPEWAAGFWQSKLRYKTQEEALSVAREYHERGIPLSVLVIDFHHWPLAGTWRFDEKAWPDPAAMVRELCELGTECMVSIWPTVDHASENYPAMHEHAMLLRNERGGSMQNGETLESFYDATNPQARAFLWERVREGYVKHGITRFWLDTMEPELIPLEFDNTRFHLGNGLEVAGIYPLMHQRGFYEGLVDSGVDAPLTLGRSAWAGSQRFGAAVWSADIPSSFESLRRQVTGGLSIGLSGIPWWTSDIGGFHGGDVDDPGFRELLIRWFQFAVFCPIMRLHGVRRQAAAPAAGHPTDKTDLRPTVANEIWSFGDEVYEILLNLIRMRERLRPYVMEQMRIAHETGLPPMRPLFVDFPNDTAAWDVEDEYLFGRDILVAPVVAAGTRSRPVYLPAGAEWRDVWTGCVVEGGSIVEADAPIERIPVFTRGREASSVPL